MIDTSTVAYQFPCPPDYNWLPSSFSLFEDDLVETKVPSRLEIQLQCEALSDLLHESELFLRRLRLAKKETRLGV